MSGAGRSERLFGLFLVSLGPLVSALFLIFAQDPILGTARDFGVFWTASALIQNGDAAQLYHAPAFREALLQVMGPDFPDLPFLYPPHAALFLLPLALLPPLAAMAAWLCLTFLVALAGLWRDLAPRAGLVFALLISPASVVNIACGQNGYLSAGLLGGGLLLLKRHPFVAGILLGLLSYKPQLGLVLPFALLAGRHWLAFAAAVMTTLSLLLLSWLILGSTAWSLYLGETVHGQMDLLQNFTFASFAVYMAGLLAGLPGWLAALLQGGASLLAICGSIWACRHELPLPLQAAIVMTGTFLAAPYILPYDMMIVAAAILLVVGSGHLRLVEVVIFAFAWILPAFAFPPDMPIGPVIILLLFLTLLERARVQTLNGGEQ
jgi:hypothetical protein